MGILCIQKKKRAVTTKKKGFYFFFYSCRFFFLTTHQQQKKKLKEIGSRALYDEREMWKKKNKKNKTHSSATFVDQMMTLFCSEHRFSI
jgi:hypothetical protein